MHLKKTIYPNKLMLKDNVFKIIVMEPIIHKKRFSQILLIMSPTILLPHVKMLQKKKILLWPRFAKTHSKNEITHSKY